MLDKWIIIIDKFISENNNIYKLDCNHFFHDKCIINWFRTVNSNGKCPCCNDTPQSNIPLEQVYYYDHNLIEQRCSAIRRYGKKKTAPQIIKKKIEKLQILENNLKEIFKEKKEFRNEYKEILKKSNKLEADLWRKKYQIKKQKYHIVYSFVNTTIPDNVIFL